MIETIMNWIKANKILAIIAGVIAAFFLLPKLLGSVRRRRTRRKYAPVRIVRIKNKPRKTYTRGGAAKKPWQIKGSLAAKRRMARIRKMK
jgi:hypothetical protein